MDDAPFQPISKDKRKRNWAIFAVLIGFVVLIFTVTLIKLGAGAGP